MKRLALLLLCALPTWAAGAYVASYSGMQYGGSGTSLTVSAGTRTAGETVAVLVTWLDITTTITSITVCGQTATLRHGNSRNADTSATAGYLLSTPSGACNVVATLSADTAIAMTVWVASGITAFDTSTINVSQHNLATGTENVTSGAITTNYNSELVVGMSINFGGTAPGVGSGWTSRLMSTFYGIEDKAQTSAGSITATLSNNAAFSDPNTVIMGFRTDVVAGTSYRQRRVITQ